VVRLALEHIARADRLDGSGRTVGQRQCDALVSLAQAFNAGQVIGGRERPQIILTMTEGDYLEAQGVAVEAFGSSMPTWQARRYVCDSVITPILQSSTGAVLRHGRNRRTASDEQFTALAVRDGGCAFTGCDRPSGWCQAHHLIWWEHGGATNLDNLVLLCSAHHHLVHDDHWTISGPPGHFEFHPPDGAGVLHRQSAPRCVHPPGQHRAPSREHSERRVA
jgi:hypothetical protein